ncbi:oxygen-independent coproporphyrinogen III oxidase [Ekhidna sp.]|uniref:oxygen-independent coproporphyrinogen III oxidase n=1 Tax=Ekhidna sp. TaxID=2608089 RepID=UPI0032997EA7
MQDLRKYNQPVPRYTSYPTVPFWEPQNFSIEAYKKTVQSAFWESSKEISIYIHLPYCESLCTYCACNTRITKNHEVEGPYLDHVLKEWKIYLDMLPEKPLIREIHLGGGTPTFFSPENLDKLLSGIISKASLANGFQMSFEGHPANTTARHLEALHSIGFDRVSFGIQDFDLNVQKLINRMQSFEQVKYITSKAREIGYKSVNYDVVYGLPGQTSASVKNTLDQIIELQPERIAYYSYAHVPSMRPAQKSYESHLPKSDDKWTFMQLGKEMFWQAGYEEVGMDHFVLAGDELLDARLQGELHRNFMGYTPFTSKLLVGLGVSAISDSWSGFTQNEKSIPTYYEQISNGKLPIIKGHIHSRADLFFRKHILNLMCEFKTSWLESEFMEYGVLLNYELLDQLKAEGFITYNESGIKVLPEGKEIIRVICSALDARMIENHATPQFSNAI